ncbi:hypothetical protein [Paenibacillus radicis (ex Gao et al. 2016)]|uniref:Uncharacterized protein n=1 Tax=Paenibacillus radicis (ex Gao et al. 2016) TaxID=1737354 RepID=A0A917MCX5_9BACL|nr:hypothetical protein [Paenibacillus radicis (ex Gao et al. 2016)]GGG89181.1 hypothetical protein GCM10010918_54870 [Paenibacillus radicis (ex Gao et al. 2016)]
MNNLLKIMKYDWKRNNVAFTTFTAVFAIVQLFLLFSHSLLNWNANIVYIFSSVGFIVPVSMIVVFMCKTYAANLSSYSRRLIPVSGGWTIASPLVLGSIALILLPFVFYGYSELYNAVTGSNFHVLNPIVDSLSNVAAALIIYFWTLLFLTIAIQFSITLAKSVSIKKLGPWVGIAAFFIIQMVVSWIDNLLFDNDGSFNFVAETDSAANVISYQVQLWNAQLWGSAILQAVVAAIMFYTMVKLLNKRVQL